MRYNFDEIIERRGTGAIKYDHALKMWNDENIIPMWVADMDFRTPEFVTEAVIKAAKSDIYGYTYPGDSFYESICKWLYSRYAFNVLHEDIHFIPGIVPGIHFAVQAFSEKGDRIMIQPPVYHPFRQVIEATGRVVVNSPLKLVDNRYEIDFEEMDKTIEGCKMFIFCNPHNPGGRVWSSEELDKIASICEKHGILVVSDEIHADMTYKPLVHKPFAMVNDWTRNNTVTFMSPSKVFNMPGTITSYSLVFNDRLRKHFYDYLDLNDVAMGTPFAFAAAEAAYTYGSEWLEQMLDYVQGNIDLVQDYISSNIPEIKVMRPEASFLIFLDCRGLGFAGQTELEDFFLHKAHLGLSSGAMFGEPGKGFMRMNVAAPRSVVYEAMQRLETACKSVDL